MTWRTYTCHVHTKACILAVWHSTCMPTCNFSRTCVSIWTVVVVFFLNFSSSSLRSSIFSFKLCMCKCVCAPCVHLCVHMPAHAMPHCIFVIYNLHSLVLGRKLVLKRLKYRGLYKKVTDEVTTPCGSYDCVMPSLKSRQESFLPLRFRSIPRNYASIVNTMYSQQLCVSGPHLVLNFELFKVDKVQALCQLLFLSQCLLDAF